MLLLNCFRCWLREQPPRCILAKSCAPRGLSPTQVTTVTGDERPRQAPRIASQARDLSLERVITGSRPCGLRDFGLHPESKCGADASCRRILAAQSAWAAAASSRRTSQAHSHHQARQPFRNPYGTSLSAAHGLFVG
jgi:hypothetical protein